MYRDNLAALAIAFCAACSSGDGGVHITDGSGISDNNYEAVLRTAIDAINVSALDRDAERIHLLATTLLAEHELNSLPSRGLTYVSAVPFSGGIDHHYSCNATGSLVIPVYDFSGPTVSVGLEFDNCFINTEHYNGDYFSQNQSFESKNQSFNGIKATFSDGSSFTIDGDYSSTQLRAGIIKTQLWESTDYEQIDADGSVRRQSNINRIAEGRVHRDLVKRAGYISLINGSIGLIVPFENNASIEAVFNLSSSSPNLSEVAVESNLVFDGDYYAWGTLNPDNRPNFIVPDFPVSELGSTLLLEGVGGTDNFEIDVKMLVPAGSEQWNAGTVNVTGAEGSRIVMSPSQVVASMVDIRVNSSSEIIQRGWSEGFQVSLFPLISN